MPEALEQDYSQTQLHEVTKALSSGMFVHVRFMLAHMPACDIAHLLESCPHKSRAILWQLVDPDLQGETLEELSEDVRNGIIAQMEPALIAAAMEEMDDDDLAEVLRSLPDTVYQEVLGSMDKTDQARACLLYTSPSPRDQRGSRMPSSA